MHDGEAKTRALADGLGGEEGLERAGRGLGIHAAARVGHPQLGAALPIPALDTIDPYRDPPAVGHRLRRIEAEIADDLVDLGLVGGDEDGLTGVIIAQLDAAAER